MKEGISLSETQRGLAQPKINRQEQTSSVVDTKGDSARRDEMVNAKEFSLDTVEAVGSGEPYSIACAKCAKCVGPCVQRCLPQPPPPKCR